MPNGLSNTQKDRQWQVLRKAPRPLNSWTLCLLIGSFVPIPVRPVTLVTRAEQTIGVKSSSPVAYKALPPELNLGPSTSAEVGRARKTENPLSVRVMDRLQQAEAHESHAHYRQDIRQAWITTSLAQKNVPEPFVEASYTIYGIHPENVWPAIVADRKARLGAEYHEWYTSDDILRPDVPKFSPTTAHRANEGNSANWDGSVALIPTHKEELV